MLVLLSPSKTLEVPKVVHPDFTYPEFLSQIERLIRALKTLSIGQISNLMDLSENLSKLNYDRYKKFSIDFNPQNSKPAIYSFKGDVYDGFDVESLSNADIKYAGNHLRILSGLYGVLRPLDLIQPYRLEMGIKLKINKYNNLYQFWGDQIALKLNELNEQIIVNLASNEYFKAVNKKILNGQIITPVFKEKKGKDYKIVMIYAKQARGMMASFIIKNRITKVDKLKEFSMENYKFNSAMSKDGELVFVR